MMKKLLQCLLLVACLVVAVLLPGCGQGFVNSADSAQPVTLRICVDAADYDKLQPWVQLYLREHENVSIDFVRIPILTTHEDDKRKQFLEQLRVEIMAGKGPDGYLFPTYFTDDGSYMLFSDLEKSMRAGVFANLDKLMDDAPDFSRDDYIPAVLAAGQADGRQYILPMGYDIDGLPVTDAMLTEIGFDAQAAQQSTTAFFSQCTDRWAWPYIPVSQPFTTPLVDLDTLAIHADTPAMRAYLPLWSAQTKPFRQEEERAAREAFVMQWYEDSTQSHPDLTYLMISPIGQTLEAAAYRAKAGDRDTWFLPVPSETGGTTGRVSGFAAVGANSKHPAEVFALLQTMLSESAQCGDTKATFFRLSSPSGSSLPVRKDCLERRMENWVKSASDTISVEMPSARYFESVAQAQAQLQRVYLPVGISLQNIWADALKPYALGECDLDTVLKNAEQSLKLYAEE